MIQLLDKSQILARAKLKWNEKTRDERIRAGSKYKHFVSKYHLPASDWIDDFDMLTKSQQNIIVKGELIRYYDSLQNRVKTQIMREYNLSAFASKWYKLQSDDKMKLLNHIIE